MRFRLSHLLWLILGVGILLRLTDLSYPDFATDEAQFALGASAAQPPLGMAFFRTSLWLFGDTLFAARGVSALFGILTPLLIALIAREIAGREAALRAAAIASIIPSHILFSRLAYLSVVLTFFWLLTLIAFLRAKKTTSPQSIIFLFASSLMGTFIKTQGILLPGFLLLGRVIERRGRVLRDPVFWILAFSLIPILLFIATHPGIPATLLLYGGNMYGLSGLMSRFVMLFATWWQLLLLALPILLLGIAGFRRLPWPVWGLVLIGSAIGLLLGPGHPYYAVHLVYWSLPLALALSSVPSILQGGILTLLFVNTLALLMPRTVAVTPWTSPLERQDAYWNTHADAINTAIGGVDEVVVLGSPGHHIRWYIASRVLVGKDMDITNRKGTFLLLSPEERSNLKGGDVVYDDGQTMVVERE
ncbi:MAG: glycosyltransferase family 39 protein [Candidatus Peregrinibacteria bacterium]